MAVHAELPPIDSLSGSLDELIALQHERLARVPADLDTQRHLLQAQLAEHPDPSTAAMVRGLGSQVRPDARRVLVHFDAQLRARGTRLLVVPVPSGATLHAHRKLPDVGREAEFWPELTELIVDLLENGVEVLDLRDAFAAAAAQSTLPVSIHSGGDDWTHTGMAIAAHAVARRLYAGDEVSALPMANPASPAGIGPVLVFGDSHVITGAEHPDAAGFADHLTAELGFVVPFAGQASPASMTVDNYARWFGHVEPQPSAVVLVLQAAGLVRDDWLRADIPPVPLVTGPAGPVPLEAMAADGTVYPFVGSVGPVVSLRVMGRVGTVSATPALTRVLYGDALSVAEVHGVAPAGSRMAIVEYVVRDGYLTDFADLQVGERLWLRLLPIVGAGSEALRTTMVVDDTDGFDLERYFVLERSRAIQALPPVAGHRLDSGPAGAPVLLIGAGAVAGWPPLFRLSFGESQRSAAPGEGAAQALWRLERAARAAEQLQRHPRAVVLVLGDADIRSRGVGQALTLAGQLAEAGKLLFPRSRLLLTTAIPDNPNFGADGEIARVAQFNSQLVERYRRSRRIELVDLTAVAAQSSEAIAIVLAATLSRAEHAS